MPRTSDHDQTEIYYAHKDLLPWPTFIRNINSMEEHNGAYSPHVPSSLVRPLLSIIIFFFH